MALMLLSFFKPRTLLLSTLCLPVGLIIFIVSGGQDWLRGRLVRWAGDGGSSTSATIEHMQEVLGQDQQLLRIQEEIQSRLRDAVVRQRKLSQTGATSDTALAEAEGAYVASLRQLHGLQAQVLETQIAITEAVLGEKVNRIALVEKNVFRETEGVARFTGGARWSLKDAPSIQNYFAKTFGYNLPISAYGQSATHSRLGLDHRNAIDVALYPDSTEGRALIGHLRQSGIPFMVFKGAVMGASTGPHIHIGHPSGHLHWR